MNTNGKQDKSAEMRNGLRGKRKNAYTELVTQLYNCIKQYHITAQA